MHIADDVAELALTHELSGILIHSEAKILSWKLLASALLVRLCQGGVTGPQTVQSCLPVVQCQSDEAASLILSTKMLKRST
jgi:hypothetical protein